MLNRRTFVSAFVGGSVLYRALPVPATALADALRNADLVEGQNVIIDRRVTDSPDTLPVLVGELLRFQPDVIVAFWNRDVVATREATRSIPIVMVIGVDPVGAGLVASLARPGGT
jgi:putative tryptophan/tyrosine transport system substrate-binding protein